MKRAVLRAVAALVYLGSCANATVLRPTLSLSAFEPAIGVDDSAICRGLAERFLGLPAVEEPGQASAGAAPLAGRWWIRSCSATRSGAELRIRLKGPGWYWVERRDSGIVVKQQVPFQLSLEVDGELDGSATDGVFYLWFTPTRPARVQMSAPASLAVRSESAWGWLLTHLPLASPGATAAERFASVMTRELQQALASGATVTYDIASGQADAALGRLEPGKVPDHPFKDAGEWLVNERLLLPPSAAHVVGPLAPGPLQLEIAVERGPGVAHRSVCAQRMPEAYGPIAAGKVSDVPADAWVSHGTAVGHGRHVSSIVVEPCSHYLVIVTAGNASTLAALRLRR
jgi:hypothetical protein